MKNKGITLIALVITIIILIILAGVSISVVMGDNGIASRAKQAAEEYKKAALKERIELALLDISLNQDGIISENNIRNVLNNELGPDGYTLTVDPESGNFIITVDDVEVIVTPTGEVTIASDNTPGGGNNNNGDTNNYTPVSPVPNNTDPATSSAFGANTKNYPFTNPTNGEAKLDLGEAVNVRLKKVAGMANGISKEVVDTWTVEHEDTYITSIVWSSTAPTDAQKVDYGQLAMTSDSPLGQHPDGTTNQLIVSDVPIYAWYDNGTIYLWSSDSTLQMHPHSERMFQGMTNLTTISGLSHFVPNSVETARYMFSGTNISDFSVCNNWDITNIKTQIASGSSANSNSGFYQMCNNTQASSHPTFTAIAGTWDNEGTFIPGSATPTLVSKLLDLGNSMPSTYGYSVDYSVTVSNNNGNVTLDNWKLLYCDGTNAYLISGNYINTNIIGDATLRKDFNASTWDKTIISGSQLTASQTLGTTWETDLGTASNWTQLVNNTYAAEAYGAPTLSMWLASWNAKYPTYALTASDFNHDFWANDATKIREGQRVNGQTITATQEGDLLYFNGWNKATTADDTIASRYPLATKYDANNIYMIDTDYYKVLGYERKSDENEIYDRPLYIGLRPVIKLKADTLGTINNNGTITLGE